MTGPDHRRHVVVTRKRTGLGSDLVSVIGAIAYAGRTGRDVVIDWRDSRYVHDRKVNMFGELFVLPDAFDDVKAYLAGPNFSDRSLPSPVRQFTSKSKTFEEFQAEMELPPRQVGESVIVTRPMHYLPSADDQRRWLETLRPVPTISVAIEAFFDKYMRGRHVVGIHIRHGNGEALGSGRDAFVGRTISELVEVTVMEIANMGLPDDHRIFVCTDSRDLREAFEKRLANVFTYDSRLGEAQKGPIHTAEYGLKGAQDAVAEMWLLARCQSLIYTPSWFSHYARTLGSFAIEPINIDTISLYSTRELYKKPRIQPPSLKRRILKAIRLGK